MIPVYNCGIYIPQVIQSVLSQDMGEEKMQIEVIDDASTDVDVETLVKDIGKGRIKYYRQVENVGSLRNFETCINRSKGKLVHLLHGDDRILKGFYQKMENLFEQYPQAGAAFCNYVFINEKGEVCGRRPPEEKKEGILNNWLIRIAEKQRIQFSAMVVRRKVYEQLGSFYGASYGEDWEMWVRIAKNYPVAYTPEVLAEYRGHTGSLTWKKVNSGQIFPDLLQVIKNINKHIPEKGREKVTNRTNKHCAHLFVGYAIRICKEKHGFSNAQVLIQQALTFDKSPHLLLRIGKIYLRILMHKVSKNFWV